MGRPALNLTRTHIGFSPETLARIDALVGEKGRAAFIRKAVDQMVDAVELSRQLEAKAQRRAE